MKEKCKFAISIAMVFGYVFLVCSVIFCVYVAFVSAKRGDKDRVAIACGCAIISLGLIYTRGGRIFY